MHGKSCSLFSQLPIDRYLGNFQLFAVKTIVTQTIYVLVYHFLHVQVYL